MPNHLRTTVNIFPFPEKFCIDPPQDLYRGTSDWNEAAFSGKRTPYGTNVTYRCNSNAMMLAR